MKSEHQRNVEAFIGEAKDQAPEGVPERPTVLPEDQRILCARLIMEEALELIEKGLGVEVHWDMAQYGYVDDDPAIHATMEKLMLVPSSVVSMEEIADGVADLRYVATYTAALHGIDMTPIQEAVDKANADKFRGDAHMDEDTRKWIKPSDWQAPDILGLLMIQGWEW